MVNAAQYNDHDLEIHGLVLPGGETLSIRAPAYVDMDGINRDRITTRMSIRIKYANQRYMRMLIPLNVSDEYSKNIMVFALSKEIFVIVLNFEDPNADSPLFLCHPGKCSSEFRCRSFVEGGHVSAVMEHEGCLVVVAPQGRISMYDIDSSPKLMWSADFFAAAAVSVQNMPKAYEVVVAARVHLTGITTGPPLTELLIEAGEAQVCRSRSAHKGDLHEYIREGNVLTFIISSNGPIFDGCLPDGCFWRLADDEPGLRRVEGAMPRVRVALPKIVSGPMKRTSCMAGKRKRCDDSDKEEAAIHLLPELPEPQVIEEEEPFCVACGDVMEDYTNNQVCACDVNCCDECARSNPNDDDDHERYCENCVEEADSDSSE